MILADTSVLVAAFVEAHPRHTACLAWLEREVDAQGVALSTHATVEL